MFIHQLLPYLIPVLDPELIAELNPEMNPDRQAKLIYDISPNLITYLTINLILNVHDLPPVEHRVDSRADHTADARADPRADHTADARAEP